MIPERRGQEGSSTQYARWKNGLETPLQGRLWRETRLLFAPPVWYDILTWCCMAFGVACFLAVFIPFFNIFVGFVPINVQIWLGPVVFVAGLWGQLSSERMTIDIPKKIYSRREGQGLFKRNIRGSTAELDAIVATAEIYPLQAGMTKVVVYRLVLHWKNQRHPLLIIDRQQANVGSHEPLNKHAGQIVAQGARFAHILGIAFYDNTYFASDAPLKAV